MYEWKDGKAVKAVQAIQEPKVTEVSVDVSALQAQNTELTLRLAETQKALDAAYALQKELEAQVEFEKNQVVIAKENLAKAKTDLANQAKELDAALKETGKKVK